MAWQATGGNLKGPKGDPGTNGAKGDAGKSLHVANITVSDNSDVSVSALSPATPIATGDLISDVDGRLFTVSSVVNGDTVHVSNQIDGVTFKGPKGDKGEDGKPGADGKDGTGVNIKGSYDSPDALKQEHPTGVSATLTSSRAHCTCGPARNGRMSARFKVRRGRRARMARMVRMAGPARTVLTAWDGLGGMVSRQAHSRSAPSTSTSTPATCTHTHRIKRGGI